MVFVELRLARLALDPNNSPAWEMSEQDLRPATRMPLFVNAHPVYTAQPSSEVYFTLFLIFSLLFLMQVMRRILLQFICDCIGTDQTVFHRVVFFPKEMVL